MHPIPFVLIGLPGIGKTTTFNQIQQILAENNAASLYVIDADQEIKRRLTQEDPVFQRFLAEHPNIDPNIFAGKDIPSADFICHYGEELWRELESAFVINMANNFDASNSMLDLGGKAFLHEQAKKAILANNFVPIFLYAEHSVIIDRLANNENWRSKGNYLLAGEVEHDGWKSLAEKHRQERTPDMYRGGRLIIDVSEMSPVQVAEEILYCLREHELRVAAKSENPNINFNASKVGEKLDSILRSRFAKLLHEKSVETSLKSANAERVGPQLVGNSVA